MVIRTELCSFSELKIYPGHGTRFVAKDGRSFYFLNGKAKALAMRKVRSQKIQWTVAWRRLNKKIKTDELAKKKRVKVVKVQRAIVGISLEDLNKTKTEKPEVRKAEAEKYEREMKARKQKELEQKKKVLKNTQPNKKDLAKTTPAVKKAQTKGKNKK